MSSGGDPRDLWAAIRAAPEDDAPRLAYAECLAEQGQPERAQLIRVQCALAKLGPDRRAHRKARLPLETEEKVLLDAHAAQWLIPYQAILLGQKLGFERGLVGSPPFGLFLGLEEARRLAATGGTLEPVDSLRIMESQVNYRPESVAEIARWTGAGSILGFSLSGGSDADIGEFVRASYLRNLQSIGVWQGTLTDSGVTQLAAWPFAASLVALDLKKNPIGDTGAFALADSPYLEHLRRLDLISTQIGPAGQARLRERFGNRVLF